MENTNAESVVICEKQKKKKSNVQQKNDAAVRESKPNQIDGKDSHVCIRFPGVVLDDLFHVVVDTRKEKECDDNGDSV